MQNPEITSLYKYRPLNTNSIQAIVNEVAWFSTPESFNDPFDCGIHLDDRRIEETVNHGERIAVARKNKNVEKITDQEFEARPSHKEVFMGIRDCLYRLFQRAGILSLSEVNDDILMWAHYGDCHKGFCIEYERSADNVLGKQAAPVSYHYELPSLTPKLVITEGESVEELWLTKSKHWR